jgi:hypothetical protein
MLYFLCYLTEFIRSNIIHIKIHVSGVSLYKVRVSITKLIVYILFMNFKIGGYCRYWKHEAPKRQKIVVAEQILVDLLGIIHCVF